MHVTACMAMPDPRIKVHQTKFGEEMSTGQTPDHAKFCGDADPTRMSEISAIENLWSPKKWTKVHQKFSDMLLTKASIITNPPKFCRNRLKMWWYPRSKICAAEKVGQNSPKSQDLLSPSCQISSRSVKLPLWRKALQNFSHPWIFWLPILGPPGLDRRWRRRVCQSEPRLLTRRSTPSLAGVINEWMPVA